MDDVVNEFVQEGRELLEGLDRDLVALEREPDCRERIDRVFRAFHTLKGTAGILGFERTESVTHAGENLLTRVRDGSMEVTTAVTGLLLEVVDAVRDILEHIAGTGQEPDKDLRILEAQLGFELAIAERRVEEQAGPVEEPAPAPAPMPLESKPAESKPAGSAEPSRPADLQPGTDTNIRVSVDLLDRLMNLVGELVLARNQLMQHSALLQDPAVAATGERIDLITTELQEGVMKTRMQAIGTVWSRLPRMVRDLGQEFGKRVRLEMTGKETELDKTIIEAIKDPLTHIVRNAVDHGLETPEQREAAGKDPEGVLSLRAWHEGGLVNIEVSDDGRGLDLEKVRRRAAERKIIPQSRLDDMSDQELRSIVFLPGFSTSDTVTSVSGRGVGMDVVRTNIEQIGGSIDLQSVAGRGTTIKVKIPLTLAIIPAVMVTAGGDRYALPQANLLELVRVDGEDPHGIEDIHGAPVYRLRGQLLPLVFLNEQLGLDIPGAEGDRFIVVLQGDGYRFGLVVDEVNDTEEIVVKPLGAQLNQIDVFSGATIMGDGTVALILDVFSLARACGLSETREDERGLQDGVASGDAAPPVRMLLVSIGNDERLALPLDQVSRIEEGLDARVEQMGPYHVVLYRDELLPLIHLGQVLESSGGPLVAPLNVVVCGNGRQAVGVVIDHIIDIVEAPVRACPEQDLGPGTAGVAVIDRRVIRLVDVRGVFDHLRLPRLCPAA